MPRFFTAFIEDEAMGPTDGEAVVLNVMISPQRRVAGLTSTLCPSFYP